VNGKIEETSSMRTGVHKGRRSGWEGGAGKRERKSVGQAGEKTWTI